MLSETPLTDSSNWQSGPGLNLVSDIGFLVRTGVQVEHL